MVQFFFKLLKIGQIYVLGKPTHIFLPSSLLSVSLQYVYWGVLGCTGVPRVSFGRPGGVLGVSCGVLRCPRVSCGCPGVS